MDLSKCLFVLETVSIADKENEAHADEGEKFEI